MSNFTHKLSLTLSLGRRDFSARYKGSAMGVLWSFLTPLSLLLVYSFVFSFVLKTRWGIENESHGSFAVILFSGLVIHTLFAEVLSRTPLIITHNPNYVKKVIFPLPVLPLSIVLSSLLHFFVSVILLFVASFAVLGKLPLTVIYLPLVILPFIIFLSGLSLFFSALGVYLRDIYQITPLLNTALLFLSPIMYPIQMLPEFARKIILLNPLTVIVNNLREILIFGHAPDFFQLFVYTGFAVFFFAFSWCIFKTLRKGFADVI